MARVRHAAIAMLAIVADNVNLVAFALGFATLYVGVAGAFSVSVANIVAGGLLMGAAAWPYLMVRKS